MTEIIPAILPKSYDELIEKLDIAATASGVVQIDVCDGGYTPSRTWPFLKGPEVEDTIFNDIVAQEKAFPHWEELDLEFDLMIKNASLKIPDFISAGATRIVVHKASLDDEELASIIKDYGKHSDELGIFDIELGVALLPSETAESIKDIVQNIHFVQIMGIEKVGFQGHPMSSRAIELVKSVRAAYPTIKISVDGGVNLDTAPKLIEAGANCLVVGSALFNELDFADTLDTFRSL